MNAASVFDAIPQAVLLITRDYTVRYWNTAFERWTGISREQITGRDVQGFFPALAEPSYILRIEQLFAEGVPVILSSQLHSRLFPCTLANGKPRYQQISITPIEGDKGEKLALFTVVDVSVQTETVTRLNSEIHRRAETEKKLTEAVAEKELLIREVHHRVKNSLALVASIISLHAMTLDAEDERIAGSLEDIRAKVESMSLLYSKLYRGGASETIDLEEYLGDLAGNVLHASTSKSGNMRLSLELERVEIETDRAISIGLIVVELMTNSIKHSGADTICLKLSADRESCFISVEDNGKGIPADISLAHASSFGMIMVKGLVEQTGGKVQYGPRPGGGASSAISVPLRNPRFAK